MVCLLIATDHRHGYRDGYIAGVKDTFVRIVSNIDRSRTLERIDKIEALDAGISSQMQVEEIEVIPSAERKPDTPLVLLHLPLSVEVMGINESVFLYRYIEQLPNGRVGNAVCIFFLCIIERYNGFVITASYRDA